MLTCTMYAKIVHGDDQGRFIESVKCKTTRFPTQQIQFNGKMFQKHTEKIQKCDIRDEHVGNLQNPIYYIKRHTLWHIRAYMRQNQKNICDLNKTIGKSIQGERFQSYRHIRRWGIRMYKKKSCGYGHYTKNKSQK